MYSQQGTQIRNKIVLLQINCPITNNKREINMTKTNTYFKQSLNRANEDKDSENMMDGYFVT